MLSCSDLARSLAFYGSLLGGVESYRFPVEGEPVFVTLAFGDTSEVGLGRLTAEPVHGIPQRPASGHRIELCVYVEDVDETYEAARRSGFDLVADRTDMPWGERAAWLSDPDGNLVMVTPLASRGPPPGPCMPSDRSPRQGNAVSLPCSRLRSCSLRHSRKATASSCHASSTRPSRASSSARTQLEQRPAAITQCYYVEHKRWMMAEVGIRMLKQNASAVVAQVAAGETLIVTDRGRPVARLTPLGTSPLERALDAGQARVARRSMTSLPRPLPGPSLSEALREARDAERY